MNIPKNLLENFEQFKSHRDITEWDSYLKNVLDFYKEYLHKGYLGSITPDTLYSCSKICAKQYVENRGNYTAIYYRIYLMMPDGNEIDGREIGPYKHTSYRPAWTDNAPDFEMVKEQSKSARAGARMEKELELWVLEQIKQELLTLGVLTPDFCTK